VIRGVHILALTAVLLAAASVRVTEVYATRYQSLPVLDWLESRPPLAESASLPAATDLARGLADSMPLLTIRDDARPELSIFGPPAVVQRTVGGVRDSARIVLGSPGTFQPGQLPVQTRLDVLVFNRAIRAAGWSELMAREMDIRDPENGLPQARLTGPDDADSVWVVRPVGGGIATVVGHRGPVGFVLQVTVLGAIPGPSPADPVRIAELSARAEVIARQAATDWAAWLERNSTIRA
jgi:hypothetical protein